MPESDAEVFGLIEVDMHVRVVVTQQKLRVAFVNHPLTGAERI